MDAESGSLSHGGSKNMVVDKVCSPSNTARHRFLFPTKQPPKHTERDQNAGSAFSNNGPVHCEAAVGFASLKKSLLRLSMYSHKTDTEDRACMLVWLIAHQAAPWTDRFKHLSRVFLDHLK